MDAILDYYIYEMTKEEIPVAQADKNMDVGFDYFYRTGLDLYISKLGEDKMMKITRIMLIESYHNEKIRNFADENKITLKDILEILLIDRFNLSKEIIEMYINCIE